MPTCHTSSWKCRGVSAVFLSLIAIAALVGGVYPRSADATVVRASDGSRTLANFSVALMSAGLPASFDEIVGLTIGVAPIRGSSTGQWFFKVLGGTVDSDEVGYHIDLYVTPSARFVGYPITRIMYTSSPHGWGWNVEYEVQVLNGDVTTRLQQEQVYLWRPESTE